MDVARRALASLVVAVAGAGCGDDGGPREHAWTIVYHMPYDNDLSRAAEPILDALELSLESDRVAVVAQVDGAGPGGMRRYLMTANGRRTEDVTADGSAEPGALEGLLEWAAERAPAERWAVVLPGHGHVVLVSAADALDEPVDAKALQETRDLPGVERKSASEIGVAHPVDVVLPTPQDLEDALEPRGARCGRRRGPAGSGGMGQRTFRVRLSRQSDGKVLAFCDSPVCMIRADSEEEALLRIRPEIRYRLEFCPCSGVTEDYVRLEVERRG